MTNGTHIVLDTPEKIDAYRILSLRTALKLKVRAGLDVKRGISLIKIAREYGFRGRTNKAALEFVDELWASICPPEGDQ